ncbi:MBL fold metallo-hydrolase [Pelobacter seleniigenes]|uniref:MBL fold metallo-hydrolase n=1 Tax=Pelobacter seleniigenes TaxID=407188 RepID=UPI0004A705DA|nr:MBL fold metallo-hydrolase [Pelobacter seleniigenes]
MIPQQHTLNTPYLVGPVHCYSAELAGELVLFDCGPPSVEALAQLQRTIPLERLKHIVISHCHVDHYGLAAQLQQQTGAKLYLPYRDHLRLSRTQEHIAGVVELLREAGFPDKFTIAFSEHISVPDLIYPTSPSEYLITEQELPARLGISVLPCPGHSQSDLALCGAGWAVTGDIMLAGIFQAPVLEIDLLTGQRFSNYQAYCTSLERIATLRDKTILPGHRQQVTSVDNCLLFYLHKLLSRAERVCRFPAQTSPYEIVKQLLGINYQLPYATYAKASEIIFIRDFLADPERLKTATINAGLYPLLVDQLAAFITDEARRAS